MFIYRKALKMQVGAVSMAAPMPYVYNTNRVDRASLNKIEPIEDDVLASKTDFSILWTMRMLILLLWVRRRILREFSICRCR